MAPYLQLELDALLKFHGIIQDAVDTDFKSLIENTNLSECSDTELVMLCEAIYALNEAYADEDFPKRSEMSRVPADFFKKLHDEIEDRALSTDDSFDFVMLVVAERNARENGRYSLDIEDDRLGKKIRYILKDDSLKEKFTEGQILKLKQFKTPHDRACEAPIAKFKKHLTEDAPFADVEVLMHNDSNDEPSSQNTSVTCRLIEKGYQGDVGIDKLAVTTWMIKDDFWPAYENVKVLKKVYQNLKEGSVADVFFKAIRINQAIKHYNLAPSKRDNDWMGGFTSPAHLRNSFSLTSLGVRTDAWRRV